ncbi:MAG: 4-hydroxy-tetrahydrodipicolinate synthase [Thiofilum sp.]|uniref:4-hydroxy-tetrahydrodipicolinate synthase n=1 Tax=Thiofilum sp. TaxID=2212733 RepID=UPI0025F1EFB6|nr:4-hydroxy-tetrahydrodipicolinate synthase [Thiofilum sp.]MBK8455444.1 4-hydroxy-tetrahydrodipicolinate synthase [Thiofilum sp.]
MFSGSYVALITPFRDGQVDETALRKMVNWHIAQGTNGLIPMGTTGESSTVSAAEHEAVVRIVIEETAGRIPVIAGAGSNNPIEAVHYAHYAQAQGASAVLCVAGYYNRPSQEGLYQHFKYLHDNTDLPIIVYNIPPRAVVDIKADTMARIAALPRVVGVKDATGDITRISQERQLIKKPFAYLSGDDMNAVAYNALGGKGCISVTANIAPQLCAQLQTACTQGDYRQALAIHERLVPLHQALFREPNPSGPKYAASLLGLCTDEVRLPMVPLSAATKAEITQCLTQLELI